MGTYDDCFIDINYRYEIPEQFQKNFTVIHFELNFVELIIEFILKSVTRYKLLN